MKKETDKNTNIDFIQVAKKVIKLEAEAVYQLLDKINDQFSEAVELVYQCKGRVIVTGLGKSGNIGRKIAGTLASTGTASYFLHAAEGVHGDIGIVSKDDVVIFLSKSGNSDELFNLLPILKRIGVSIISITGNLESTLAKQSNIVLNIGKMEEACPHDLAPTTSTTAMLAYGDALAIALLEKRQFSREDFAFLHPAGTLGKRLMLKVGDLMESGKQLPMLEQEATMKQAVIEIASKRGICIVVAKDRKVVGVITNGDLNRLIERTEHFFHIPVVEVMNKKPKIIDQSTLAYTTYKKMEQFCIIVMPVIDKEEKLVGVIHLHDIMRAGIV